ncbi:hypothetical protein GH714_019577 [Hevea brasiliensis]|uniref:Uncharacterized protein n=1 Tax=Hevea brasiliensis TaxID=3981 RepID=A0A6A6MF22_HEVBR|nr:hypothetical protein GH714_019512 [Hevea brasiliensis]KAF2311115.1 hypothetical protein GH714_019577 [Hevea brasiliensis]
MEAEKRKREDDAKSIEGEKSKEKGVVNGGEAVAEEEVEEFFAILRRIHVAVKYFEKNDGGKRWKPSFEIEDFEEVNGEVEGEKKEEDSLDESTGFDLNSDPPSEDNAVNASSAKLGDHACVCVV